MKIFRELKGPNICENRRLEENKKIIIGMNDHEVISRSFAALGVAGTDVFLVKKGGRVLLALPRKKEAALMALRLYQPQRIVAKVFVWCVEWSVRLGVHGLFCKKLHLEEGAEPAGQKMTNVETGSEGVLLGNPNHKVQRAIASYWNEGRFEVAKMAFGSEGVDLIDGEAATIQNLPKGLVGIPEILGTQNLGEVGMMRLPYFRGRCVNPNEPQAYLTLLDQWVLGEAPCLLNTFPEWEKIRDVLSSRPRGDEVFNRLNKIKLTPSVRHGDFAPWNLLRNAKGDMLALDWEWGVPWGVPGFDLVHFLSQDLRLVQRLSPEEIVDEVETALGKDLYQAYLKRVGWGDARRELFIAAMAFSLGSNLEGSGPILDRLLTASLDH